MKKIILITGGFDPLHSGHMAYIQAAAKLGDRLIIGLNSDAWLTRKKGAAFMPWTERATVLRGIKYVSSVIPFNDDDGSARQAILDVRKTNPDSRIIFANGGDRTPINIPEMDVLQSDLIIEPDIEFVFGVGGEDKANSSSWILQDWKLPITPRAWGYYRILHLVPGMKVKELVVDPGKSLSMQRHEHRSEHWIVSEGTAVVNSKHPDTGALITQTLEKHETYDVAAGTWHQLTNPFKVPLKLVEVQYGVRCVEEDITRDN